MAEAQVLNGEETLQRSEGRVLPYEQWKKDEGLPSYHGFWIENLYNLELAPWESRGGTGAFVNLEGTCGFNDAYVYELAPKESSKPIKHIYEETVFLLFPDRERQILGDARRFQSDVLALWRLQFDRGPREDDGLAFPRRLAGREQPRIGKIVDAVTHRANRHPE